MEFENLNERGHSERLSDGSALFSFSYENKFYGSCSFVARVVQTRTRGLILDDDSLRVEEYRSRPGSLPALEASARVFFNRVLREFSTVQEFEMLHGEDSAPQSRWGWVEALRTLGRKLIPSGSKSSASV